MPWVPYITAFVGVIFVLDLIGKLIPTKWRALQLMSPIQVTFCRDNTCHYFCEVKVMTSTKESFCKYSQITVYFSKKVPSKMFDGILNTPLNYIPVNTIHSTILFCSAFLELPSIQLSCRLQADFWAVPWRQAFRIYISGTWQLYEAFYECQAFRI